MYIFAGKVHKFLSVGIIVVLFMIRSSSANCDAITAVWANDGEDKVTQDELRASTNAAAVLNSVWNGKSISLFAAKNEVISFNLILETGSQPATDVNVSLSNLAGPKGSVIRSAPRAKNQLFNWTASEAELFFVCYLQIKGLSKQDWGCCAGSGAFSKHRRKHVLRGRNWHMAKRRRRNPCRAAR